MKRIAFAAVILLALLLVIFSVRRCSKSDDAAYQTAAVTRGPVTQAEGDVASAQAQLELARLSAQRTREIGVRLAVGAHGRDILTQFLIEAVALSLVGGLIGIALGLILLQVLSLLAHWPTQVSITSILAAFFSSAGVGVFFGFYPAREASRLDPIEALRYE